MLGEKNGDSLIIMVAEVRQSSSKETLRLHRVLNMSMQPVHARLRAQPTSVEMMKPVTSSARTTSTATKPALQSDVTLLGEGGGRDSRLACP